MKGLLFTLMYFWVIGGNIAYAELIPSASTEVVDLSIINLITTPERYNGKLVRIIGYVELQFEGTSIYLSKYANASAKNGLWLDSVDPKIWPKYNKKYCLIEGTFNSNNQGHMGMWSGAIENIQRFEVWRLEFR